MTQPPQGQWPPNGPLPPPHHWPSPYPPFQPQPPKKKPAGLIVAICVAVAAVLVVSGVVVVALVNSGSDRQSAGEIPRATVPGAPGNSGGGATTTPPAGSSAPPSKPSSPNTATKAGPQKVFKLGDHPILLDPEAGLKNRACSLPAWQSNQAGAEAFFTAASKCLDAAWGPFLEYYDLPFVSPTLHFPTGSSFQTDCATVEVGIATAAYYCENNLYVPFRGLQTDQYGNNPGVYLALFAHEYGHHVQEVAGLMDAAWEKIYEAGQNSAAGLEMARRKELQAQCFSGMFLGAHVDRGGTINRDMYDKAWDDQATRGDNTSGSKDHGTNAHYAAWWRAGAKDNRIVNCNTFSASASDVS